MAHTPGPWHVNGIDAIHSVKGNRSVAKVYHPEDDARLIAAAPELLAALKAALPILRQAHDRGFAIKEVEPVYNQAEAAIAKAE